MAVKGQEFRSLQELADEIEISPGFSYDIDKYMRHLPDCKQPRGDQCCQCGMSQTRWNVETLIDTARFASGWQVDTNTGEWTPPLQNGE